MTNTTKKEIKITGLKKAVGTYNGNNINSVRIFFDTADGKVWANEYASGNEYSVYHQDTIHEVLTKASLEASWNKTTMVELKKLCEEYL